MCRCVVTVCAVWEGSHGDEGFVGRSESKEAFEDAAAFEIPVGASTLPAVKGTRRE